MEQIKTIQYSKRIYPISRITIHCAGYVGTAEKVCEFLNARGDASTHYAIGTDGEICSMVDEKYRAWCTGNSVEGLENDYKTVNIECCQSELSPDYPITDETYKSLIALCVDICIRNNIKRLIVGETLTAHRWYANKSCPGDYIYNRFNKICEEVNKVLEDIEKLKKAVSKLTTEYNWFDALPEWAKPTYHKLDMLGIKLGKEDGYYHHSEDMVKMLVMLDKLGVIKCP